MTLLLSLDWPRVTAFEEAEAIVVAAVGADMAHAFIGIAWSYVAAVLAEILKTVVTIRDRIAFLFLTAFADGPVAKGTGLDVAMVAARAKYEVLLANVTRLRATTFGTER